MKPESDPIADDEWLLRRVRIDQFRTEVFPQISPNAFEPRIKGRDPDVDGISLYQAACLADPADILAAVSPDRIREYGIVRVPVNLLKSLHLSVESRPNLQILGHVVIPELNSVDYAANKVTFTPIKMQLAAAASEEANIIRHPSPPESN